MQPLPAELIDHIFSFLKGDIPALKACFESHPSVSQLAERYLFENIVFGKTDGYKHYEKLSKNLRILQYIHTLEVNTTNLPFHPEISEVLQGVLSMIPRMANLSELRLGCQITYDNPIYLSILQNYLQQSSVKRICLFRFRSFPLSIVDKCKNLKKLTLSYCEALREPKSKSPHQLLEELSIRGSLYINLLNWLTDRVVNLKSLHLAMEQEHWSSIPELLSACSSSLTELHLSVSNTIKGQNPHFLVSRLLVRSWIRDNHRFPFDLSQHKCLKQLSIFATVLSTENGPVVGFDGALPAIKNFIETAPAIQDVVLRLHWVDPTPGSLAWFDYSQLFPDVSRIHLCISGDIDGQSISPASILEALAENEALMDLVKRDVVILKPRSGAPLSDDDSYA